MKNVAVIGSGMAGLSAAAVLAKNGYKVTVFEKNEQTGGRARIWQQHGFTFDMGPSWYWMPEVFDNFFNTFGKKTSDYYQLIRLNPSYKVFFKDQEVPIPATTSAVLDLFEQMEPGSKAKISKFIEKAGVKYHTAMQHYIEKPSHSITEFMDWKILTSFIKLDLFSSIKKEIAQTTNHPYIKQILEFPILFLGSTPDTTPALYSMMNYVDSELGTWYPDGGMHKIIQAMEQVAREQGVTIHLNEEVEKVDVKDNRIHQLMTTKGSYTFEGVICTADYHHFEQSVLPASHRTYDEAYWNKQMLSPSVLLFYIGLNKKLPNMEHHNLFFDADFNQHIGAIYDQPRWPEDPLFYACVPSKTDATVAPEGMENLFVLIPIANNLEQNDALIENYFQQIAHRIQERSGVDIREHIVVKRSYSVKEFKQDYHAYKGNAYGLANTLMQTAVFKPKMKPKKVKNLLFAGQLTVPGPGMPPSIISGMMAAKELIKENA